MDVSLFLAKIIGLCMLILSISILFNAKNLLTVVSGIFHNAALQFVLGIFLLVMGVLLVVSHNIWEPSWVVVVTIISWIVLLKGICYVAFPKLIHSMAQPFIHSQKGLLIGGVMNLVVALYLCYMGFIA